MIGGRPARQSVRRRTHRQRAYCESGGGAALYHLNGMLLLGIRNNYPGTKQAACETRARCLLRQGAPLAPLAPSKNPRLQSNPPARAEAAGLPPATLANLECAWILRDQRTSCSAILDLHILCDISPSFVGFDNVRMGAKYGCTNSSKWRRKLLNHGLSPTSWTLISPLTYRSTFSHLKSGICRAPRTPQASYHQCLRSSLGALECLLRLLVWPTAYYLQLRRPTPPPPRPMPVPKRHHLPKPHLRGSDWSPTDGLMAYYSGFLLESAS